MEANKDECVPELQTKAPKKGGFKTIPFIIVNESLERLASQGLTPNMMIYLMKSYQMEAATASSLLFIWSTLSHGLALAGAFLSDSYLGRFRVIVLGSISSLLGMILLWMTTLIPEMEGNAIKMFSNILLMLSFLLVSIGAGCIRPCSIAFGADQLYMKENPKNEIVMETYFNWYFASTGIACFIAVTLMVYIQEHFGWIVGFGVPVLLMVFSTLIFLSGSSFYIKSQVSESLLTGFGQVLVAAFIKRKLNSSKLTNDYYHLASECLKPSEKLRWLNKACIIQDPDRELNKDGSVLNKWILCSVDQVESTKALFAVIPMWSSGLLVFMSITAGHFPILQANSMDRHLTSNFELPAGSYNLFIILTITIWVAIYDRVLVPLISSYTGQQKGLCPITRMGIGLVIICISMAISAVVENIRRNKAFEQGVVNDPNAVVNMSALWLIPQFMLYGLGEGINGIAQIEFFYSQFPRSMSSIAVAMSTFGMAVSSLMGGVLVKVVDAITAHVGSHTPSWLSSNLNQGHLDYYYWLITILNVINFVYFLYCWRLYTSVKRYDVLRRIVPAEEEEAR